MSKINILDAATINQIAAGEVVERPASVVKELIENAIDAKATAITCEIKEGGIGFIRITDNGAGIDKEEIPTAFLRHATSKIKSVEDLVTIGSLGFRGEALSSIAAVAQVELVTKTRDAFIGCRYVIEGGIEKSLSDIGCPDGTTFLVRNLFYNTPARRKFLKSAVTEASYISELLERMAMSHPEVSFKFINNNKTILQTVGNGQIKDVIYHIYGRTITSEVIEINYVKGDIAITGFIGKPVISRGNRNFELYFINGRYIKSSIISKAIEEAYKPFTMQHKYPFTALHFSIPSDLIDVNVHPSKMEIRFTSGPDMYQLTYQVLTDGLNHTNMIPDVALEETKKTATTSLPSKAPEPFETNRRKLEPTPSFRETTTYTAPKKSSFSDFFRKPSLMEGAANEEIKKENRDLTKGTEIGKLSELISSEKPVNEIVNERIKQKEDSIEPSFTIQQPKLTDVKQETFLNEKELKKQYRIIGQLFATYWLLEYENQLYMIDQHAAHEKILYERTMKRLKETEYHMSQQVSPPLVVTLNLKEEQVLKEQMSYLNRLGFEIEEFGGKEYSICAVPADLYGLCGEDLFLTFLDEMCAENLNGTPDVILDKIASMSCKAAVKGNHKLSEEEAKALIAQLMELEHPFHCPHGRPVIISMTKQEIEKKFKRIV